MTPAGASTSTDPRPLTGAISYDTDISVCTKKKVVALTYDDGPNAYTGQLLDILKQYGYHATFFICGNNQGKGEIDVTAPYPAIVKRMIAEGHQVASHTFSHYDLDDLPSDLRKQQMVKNERAITNIIGKYPTYMRPPYSKCTAESGCQADMKALGYHRIYFDLDTGDFQNPLPSQISVSKNIVKDALTSPNAQDYLAIQHDVVEQSVTNLSPYFYDRIKAKGWKGVTVGECLGDPKVNWYRTPARGKKVF
ncbi:chitin deacetylase [Sticta canariensis]|nr:chitin deacetylase [Sticta canariensis]